MRTLTLRIPDHKHERLKSLAENRSMSVNKLIDELATIALANYDAKMQFEGLAHAGNARRALKLLEGLGDE